MTTPPGACTAACTSERENGNADRLEGLAAELLKLPAADRERLVGLLTERDDRPGK